MIFFCFDDVQNDVSDDEYNKITYGKTTINHKEKQYEIKDA